MAGNLSDYAENKILDHSTGKAAWALPTVSGSGYKVWVALYTTAPTDSTSGTEVSGGSYARVECLPATWNAASSGSTSNASAIVFPTASASWGTVTAVAITDASTAGNIIWYGTLTSNKTVDSGDTFQFAAGALTLSLN